MVFIKMLQTKTAINASSTMRNDFIYPKFLFKSNTMQPCLSNYTTPRVVQLQTNILHCRRNARCAVHTSPPRNFLECAARFFIRPDTIDHDILLNKLNYYGTSDTELQFFGSYLHNRKQCYKSSVKRSSIMFHKVPYLDRCYLSYT